MKSAFFQTLRSPFPLLILSIALIISTIEWIKPNGPQQLDPNFHPANELFDPQLYSIKSIDAGVKYCDSVYGKNQISKSDTAEYVNQMAVFIKKRFYHGYSHFSFGHNTIGWMLAPILLKNLTATVIAEDIIQFPNGACSQQSIVFFSLLKRKGFLTRKVGLFDSTLGAGHFASEVFWNGSWHFYDVNKEPNTNILESMGRPSLEEILKSPGLIDSVYKNKRDIHTGTMFKNPEYGRPNQNYAPNATIYQWTTKWISLTLPVWVLLAIACWMFIFRNKKPAEAGIKVERVEAV
jgi:hypothetical protein